MSPERRNNKGKNSPALFIIGAGVVLLVLVAALSLRPAPQTAIATITPASQHSDEDSFPEIARVSLIDSKAALDSGNAVFLDVRDAGSFAESHIPGALSIPLATLDANLGILNPNQWIIPYCT